MFTIRTLVTLGCAAAFALVLGGSAHAQLTSAQKKCIDGYNNTLRLVGQQAGKDYRSCIRNAGKGMAGANNCVVTDGPGKIAGKAQKVADLYPATCNGTEPIQQGATTGSNAMIDWSQDLIHEIFGDPISDGTVVSPGKTIAKCQDKAYKRAEQLFTEKLKAFRACKKDGMASGAITTSTNLEAQCMHDPQPFAIPDPNGKQAGKAQRLFQDVISNCGPPVGPPYTGIFPGDCSGAASAGLLGDCIETLVECKACKALNEADGMATDCDLFDDGLANGSCGAVLHKCVLDTTPTSDSQIFIHIAALPVPLTFGISGALDIGAAAAIAACGIQFINPIQIPCIGIVCISPATGCTAGSRWCGPGAGPALGIDVQSDGNVGACTSNTQCAAIAAGAGGCPAFGGGYSVMTSACTGYCSGSSPPNQACNTDAACGPANGACNGPDPVGVNANICQISCIKNDAHGPSNPGDLQCNLGANLSVESAAPCDGTDTTIAIGQTCLPVSTQEASSLITDANFVPASQVPNPPNVNDLLGQEVACATLDISTVTGLRAVGVVDFFGSALSDLAVGIKGTCN